MLPSQHRLTDAASYRRVSRTGRRAASRTLVVHLAEQAGAAPGTGPLVGLRVGLVVSKAVGNAVVRNRVKRRLRHLVREQLSSLPGSGALVVRALPAAGTATGQELRSDLDRCLLRVREAAA